MEQEQKEILLQDANQYNAEVLLDRAAKLLFKNKKIKINIAECEWDISEVSDKLILRIWYTANDNEVTLNVLETVFKDYTRKADETIGIIQTMPMQQKIILRLAYLLYAHRND